MGPTRPPQAQPRTPQFRCLLTPVVPGVLVPLLVRTSPPFTVYNQERNQFLGITPGIKMPSKLEELIYQGPVQNWVSNSERPLLPSPP